MKQFNENLEDLMRQKRITLKEFSEAVGISQKTIQEWLGTGGRFPRNPGHLKKISEFFSVSVHYLLFGTEETKSPIEDFLEQMVIHTGTYQISIAKVKPKN